jgi:hypothetical protein
MPSDKLVPRQAPPIPEDILRIFGDPPLLSTEDPELYSSLLCRVAQEVRPQNIIEWLWAKDIVDLSWEIRRLRRVKPILIERERQSRLAPPPPPTPPRPPTEAELAFASLLGQPPPPPPPSEADIRRETRRRARHRARSRAYLSSEIGSATILSDVMGDYERIDRLLVSAELRRNALLRDIKFYREGLAHLLHDSSAKIIDGEYTENGISSE